MAIEWEEKVETTRRMSLLAVHGSIGHGGATRPATLDDLRKACEAVGLVCMTSEEIEQRVRRDALAAVDLANGHANEAEARAEAAESRLAALTAPVEGEPASQHFEDVWNAAPPGRLGQFALAQWRIGHAAGRAKAATHAPRDLPRATARELEGMADAAYRMRTGLSPMLSDMRALALSVAQRVRREQCLVTRAVESGVDLHIEENCSSGVWNVETVNGNGRANSREDIAPSDVASVLSEMLGEVGR